MGNSMNPFSDNIIFFDTEFSSLDPYKGEVLSIGMVKMNGEELYLEIDHEGSVSPWVEKHILPSLTEPKVDREEACQWIADFVGKEKSYLLSYVVQYDAPYLYKLFGVGEEHGGKNLPFEWITLDFASFLFALGRDPKSMILERSHNLAEELGIDTSQYRSHHALDDAKILREIYLRLTAKRA